MALPETLNLATIRGDEFSYDVPLTSADGGWSFEAEVSSVITGASVAELTISGFVSGVESQVTISLTESETLAIPRGSYLWRLVGTLDGVRTTLREGIYESLD